MTEKFKVLGKIYSILQDTEKRKLYDDCGEFDEECDSGNFDWLNFWRSIFKPITAAAIEKYREEYINSDIEIRDVKKAYIYGKGNMNILYEMVPFLNVESEPRIVKIVRKLVDDGVVEEYGGFFDEPQRKKERRWKKYEREAKEVAEVSMKGLTESYEKLYFMTCFNQSSKR